MASQAAPLPPTGVLSEGAVATLEERLGPLPASATTPADQDEAPVVLLVIDAFRYRVDQQWRQTTKQREPQAGESIDADVFDIVVTDGTRKTKMALDAHHNDLLRRGGLLDYVIEVRRADVELCFEESKLPATHVLVLRRFKLRSELVAVDKSRLAFLSEAARQLFYRPLAGSREYYLPLWNDDDPMMDDPQWRPNLDALRAPDTFRVPARLPSLAEAIATAANQPKKVPPLVGRVVRRHTLSHFGKAMDTKDSFPYRLTFEIADESTTVPIVAWNRMAARLFAALRINQLVVVEGYKLRKQFNASAPGGIEVSVNSTNPEGSVRLLNDAHLADVRDWRLRMPERPRNYEAAATLNQLPDGTILDLIGRVLLCSRIERERSPRGTFSQFMWIAIADETLEEPVMIKLYTCSSPWDFFSLQPGSVVRLQNLKLYSICVDSRTPRQLFCVSTYSTTYNVFNGQRSELSAIVRGQQVRHVPKETDQVRALYVSGIYVGLPPPYNDVDMMRRFLEQEILPFRSMHAELANLQHLERRAFVVQGHVASISFGSVFGDDRASTEAEVFMAAKGNDGIAAHLGGIHFSPAVQPASAVIVDVNGEHPVGAVLPCVYYVEQDPLVYGMRQVFPLCASADASRAAFAAAFRAALDKGPTMLFLLDSVRLSPHSVQVVLLKAIAMG